MSSQYISQQKVKKHYTDGKGNIWSGNSYDAHILYEYQIRHPTIRPILKDIRYHTYAILY